MNGITIHQINKTILVPLPKALWRELGICRCVYCSENKASYWDTLAVSPDFRTTSLIHMPELHSGCYDGKEMNFPRFMHDVTHHKFACPSCAHDKLCVTRTVKVSGIALGLEEIEGFLHIDEKHADYQEESKMKFACDKCGFKLDGVESREDLLGWLKEH